VLDLSPEVGENLDQSVMDAHEFVVATDLLASGGAESIGKVVEPHPDSGI
jgi:hypothetical protein